MIEFISQTWEWYVAGPLIALTLFVLLYWGKTFGISGNYRVMCAALGAGKSTKFFDFDWKAEKWNLVFMVGAILGRYLAHEFLPTNEVVVSAETVKDLNALGVSVGTELIPMDIFGPEHLLSARSIVFIALGGLFVGFGTRWAGGCTSGHAISGLSNLQLPSLIAVIGFFIGGLIMTHFIFPYFLAL